MLILECPYFSLRLNKAVLFIFEATARDASIWCDEVAAPSNKSGMGKLEVELKAGREGINDMGVR